MPAATMSRYFRVGSDGLTLVIADDGRLELLQLVAATTVQGQRGVRDEAISRDGRCLYALHADVQQLFGWAVQKHGRLVPVGAFGDLPTTVAGLAAA
jgi:6-phosphogluconolactonase